MERLNFTLTQIIKNLQYTLLVLLTLCCSFVYPSVPDTLTGSLDTVNTADINRDSTSILPTDTVYFNSVLMKGLEPRMLNTLVDSLVKELDKGPQNSVQFLAYLSGLRSSKPIETPLLNKFTRPTWVVVVLSFILIFIGLVRIFFHHTFTNVIYAFFNERILSQISKEDNVLTSWPYIFLYTIFSFSLGLFILLYLSVKEDFLLLTFENYVKLSLVIGFLFVAKLLLIRIISVIFESEKLARSYITVLYLVYFNGTIFLIPLLILSVFLPFIYLDYLLIIFLTGVIIMFLYRIFRTLFGLLGHLKFSIFYLILYLCALEIAPILILVKSLNS